MSAAQASLLPSVGDWWQLPSGRVVCIRRLEGEGFDAEAVVRYLDSHGGLAQGEFNLRLTFIGRGRKVGHE